YEHDRSRVSREDQEPQEQRSLLSAPERGERVQRRQPARRVLGDVREAEVVAGEGGEEDRRRDRRRPERGDEGGARREPEPPSSPERGVPSRGGRVQRQPEADDESGPAELGHGYFLGEYLDGHFVTSVFFTPTKTPPWSRPSSEMSRPARNMSGTLPW